MATTMVVAVIARSPAYSSRCIQGWDSHRRPSAGLHRDTLYAVEINSPHQTPEVSNYMRRSRILCLAAFAAAVSSSVVIAQSPTPVTPRAPLVLADLDTTVKACTDFYQFANGYTYR